ncbi:hypothetical protein D3C72_1314680 [compost metagenome]
MAGQVEGVGQRLRDIRAFRHRGEVENGKRDHPTDMGPRVSGAIPARQSLNDQQSPMRSAVIVMVVSAMAGVGAGLIFVFTSVT